MALALLGLLSVVVGMPPSPPSVEAATIVPFDIRFETNDNGALAVFGNNVLTCPPSAVCTAVRNGTTTGGQSSNNAHAMVNLDEDGAAFPTFNSSAATVSRPPGADVLFAGLYWGARRVGASGGSTTTAPIGQMALRLPGDAAATPRRPPRSCASPISRS